MAYMKSGSPFLYDDTTGDIIGVKDRDGGETLLAPPLSSNGFVPLGVQVSGGVAGYNLVDSAGNAPAVDRKGINIASYGAKSDGKQVFDASTTNSTTTTITSASANFNPGDVGKTIVVIQGSVATGPWPARSGTIQSYISPTQITALLGTAPGALTSAQVIWGTDDTAAVQNAANAAGTKAQPLFIPPGITCIKTITLPNHVTMYGVGNDSQINWNYALAWHGSTLVATQWPGNNKAMVVAGTFNTIHDLNIDGANMVDSVLDAFTNNGHAHITRVTLARAYGGRVLNLGSASSFTDGVARGAGGSTADLIVAQGDNRIVNNDIYEAGNGGAFIRIAGSDAIIVGNHFWRNAQTAPNEIGPSILINPSVTSGFRDHALIMGNAFDTSVGAMVKIKLDGTITYRGINIIGNQAFQNNSVPSNTYSVFEVVLAAGSSLRGLGITNNMVMASLSGTTNALWKYFVDGVGIDPAATLYGAFVSGNFFDGANSITAYNSFTPAITSNNQLMQGIGATVTSF